MSIPNEALQKVLLRPLEVNTPSSTRLICFFRQLLQEIEQSAAASQQQITVVKAQIAAKTRETRLIQLTTKELAPLPEDTNVYEGVGKM